MSSLLLFLTACIWGLAFVSQSKGMEVMGPFTFNGIRSFLGALTVLPVVLVMISRRKKQIRENKAEPISWKVTLIGGALCGIFYTMASTVQQIGILHTSVGKAGFITTLYIIFVPILGLFLKKKVPVIVWIGAAFAAVGMYLLCVTEGFTLTMGDGLIFACAILFAIHILIIDHYTARTEGVFLSFIQLLVCGVVDTTVALFVEHPDFTQLKEGIVPILYSGILSCGVAYTLQIVAQKNVKPAVASLILSLESVVAALAGVVAYRIGFLQTDQSMTITQWIGCAIVFASVVLVQIPVDSLVKKRNRTATNKI